LEISHDVNEFRPEEFTQPILYEKGRAIFAQGSSINGYYIICEGVVKLIRHLSSSKQVVVALMGPGDMLP
jgi:CRP-like cAMP-binding protein